MTKGVITRATTSRDRTLTEMAIQGVNLQCFFDWM